MWPSIPGVVLQTSQSTEFWTFAVSNLLTLVLGVALAVIAFLAYRREKRDSFLFVAAGFGLIALGTIVEILYEIGVQKSHLTGVTAFGSELFLLRTAEGAFIATGLALLIYSVRRV